MTAASRERLLAYSPYESERFGLRVFRGAYAAIDIASLRNQIERERVDVAILRVPARSADLVARLASIGLPSIAADTLMHYSLDLRRRALELESVVRLRRADPGDRAVLESVARAIFDGYVSHYHANPNFEPARILDGYVEWAARHVESAEGRLVWLVENSGEIVGFSCAQLSADGIEATGVLNGILPEKRGRGLYRAMLRSMLSRFVEDQVSRFSIATHAHNVAVQRVWMSEGFMLERAETTIHINALRSHGRD